jgi:ABC-type sugar transport system ATPase subunit
MKQISLSRITHGYSGSKESSVLHGLDLRVAAGEFLVIVGPSGCGKSTLLRILAGLDVPQHGQVLFGDRDVTQVPARERNVSMVFQSYALYPHMTVKGNLELTLKMAKVDPAEREARIARVAEYLELTEVLGRKPAALSGGQRQRVAMGRAMVRTPDLFLFDEPLSNLDAELRGRLRAQIKKLHREFPATKVYVTHDQVEAMTLADRIVVLNRGRIEQVGTPTEIYDKPASLFVAQFFGSPPMNTFDGRASLALARSFSRQGPRVASDSDAEADVVCGIRPEDVVILSTGQQKGNESPMPIGAVLPGTLIDSELLGAVSIFSVETEVGTILATGGRSPSPMANGARLDVILPSTKVHAFSARTGQRVSRELH